MVDVRPERLDGVEPHVVNQIEIAERRASARARRGGRFRAVRCDGGRPAGRPCSGPVLAPFPRVAEQPRLRVGRRASSIRRRRPRRPAAAGPRRRSRRRRCRPARSAGERCVRAVRRSRARWRRAPARSSSGRSACGSSSSASMPITRTVMTVTSRSPATARAWVRCAERIRIANGDEHAARPRIDLFERERLRRDQVERVAFVGGAPAGAGPWPRTSRRHRTARALAAMVGASPPATIASELRPRRRSPMADEPERPLASARPTDSAAPGTAPRCGPAQPEQHRRPSSAASRRGRRRRPAPATRRGRRSAGSRRRRWPAAVSMARASVPRLACGIVSARVTRPCCASCTSMRSPPEMPARTAWPSSSALTPAIAERGELLPGRGARQVLDDAEQRNVGPHADSPPPARPTRTGPLNRTRRPGRTAAGSPACAARRGCAAVPARRRRARGCRRCRRPRSALPNVNSTSSRRSQPGRAAPLCATADRRDAGQAG